jgi:hypothetical protein
VSPYRINPQNKREVQVLKAGVWRKLKEYPTVEEALKRLAAMKINVEEAHTPSPKKKKRGGK